MVAGPIVQSTHKAVRDFMVWLSGYGETSWDHQTFYSRWLGRKAKSVYYKYPWIGTTAVAPMVLSEAVFPWARRFFGPRVRFPIADAHYGMGFAFLHEITGEETYYERALHFLAELKKSRCRGYANYCWGYPFDWETRTGTIRKGTPLITSTPYAYEAFLQVYRIDGRPQWHQILRSIVEHCAYDIKDFPISSGAASCSYTPHDKGGVINAAAYRAFLLTSAAEEFSNEGYREKAEHNLQFVLGAQNQDGSWFYAVDRVRNFVDHFHTCFVLKSLAKIDHLKNSPSCGAAISAGVNYYLDHLLDGDGLPRPFSCPPRLVAYRRELYDYAECINLCLLLRRQFPQMGTLLERVLGDLLRRWRRTDGSFRSRELMFGWDNVPMHRWAQAQLFRALCFLLFEEDKKESSPDFVEHHVRDLRSV